jgi:hypothetical protein
MKFHFSIFVFALGLLLVGAAGCNFPQTDTVIQPSQVALETTPTPTSSAPPSTQPQATQAKPAVTPSPQVNPTLSQFGIGYYSCSDCISDKFLDNFKIVVGVPPLEFWTSILRIRLNRAGNIVEPFIFSLDIISNPNGGEDCTHGHYSFSKESVSGVYDRDKNLLVVEVAGDVTYASWQAGKSCYLVETKQKATKKFTLMVNPQDQLILCKEGEIGDMCLNNPMAVLKKN